MRSSSSAVLRWPDAEVVRAAVRAWATETVRARREVTRIGLFGSYARGTSGVGSDVDLVVLVSKAADEFTRRPARYDASRLPVPADVIVYTESEWERVNAQGMGRVAREIVWLE